MRITTSTALETARYSPSPLVVCARWAIGPWKSLDAGKIRRHLKSYVFNGLGSKALSERKYEHTCKHSIRPSIYPIRRELGLVPCHSIDVMDESSRRRSRHWKLAVSSKVIDPSSVPIARRVPSCENRRTLIELEIGRMLVHSYLNILRVRTSYCDVSAILFLRLLSRRKPESAVVWVKGTLCGDAIHSDDLGTGDCESEGGGGRLGDGSDAFMIRLSTGFRHFRPGPQGFKAQAFPAYHSIFRSQL